MQVHLIIIGIIFSANLISAGQINNELTPEERQKILDAFNKDRQEIGKQAGVDMSILTYDSSDEKRIPIFLQGCHFENLAYLRWNSVVKEMFAAKMKADPIFENTTSIYFFDPKAKKITCSRLQRCRMVLEGHDTPDNLNLVGKTAEFYGICTIRGGVNKWNFISNFAGIRLPPMSRYADVLGVTETLSEEVVMAGATDEEGGGGGDKTQGSGAGSMLSLIISLLFVIYV